MYYNVPSTPAAYSYVSDKVRGSTHNLPSSPAPSISSWSSPAVGGSSTAAQPHVQQTPWAPRIATIPLPNIYPTHPYQGRPSLTLHPALVYDPTGRIYFNVIYPPNLVRFKPNVQVQLNEPATRPLATQMVMKIPGSPVDWTFAVVNPSGITLYDILHHIFAWFQSIMDKTELSAIHPNMQAHMMAAFNRRVSSTHIEYSQGVKRIDWLGANTFFIGLSRATDSSDAWMVHFGPPFA